MAHRDRGRLARAIGEERLAQIDKAINYLADEIDEARPLTADNPLHHYPSNGWRLRLEWSYPEREDY